MDYQVESDFVRLENGNITITESKGDFNPLCGTYNLIIGRTFFHYYNAYGKWSHL